MGSIIRRLAASLNRRQVITASIGVIMIATAFFGVAASDIHASYAEQYWSGLALGFALGSFALGWLHRSDAFVVWRSAIVLAVHWVGVFAAVHVVFFFITTDHFTDANAGLANGIVFALGTFLCGVHTDLRLAVIGAALAGAVAVEALIEENLWVLLAVAVGALVIMGLVGPVKRLLGFADG